MLRRRRHAVRAAAEKNLVQVEFKDMILAHHLGHFIGENRLADFALVAGFIAQEKVLGNLLRDGGGALRASSRSPVAQIGDERAGGGDEIHAAMFVEIFVLGGDEGVLNNFRNRFDRDEDALFLREFGQKSAVPGIKPRDDRGLVIAELGIIRQILAVMADDVGYARHPDNHADDSEREQPPE